MKTNLLHTNSQITNLVKLGQLSLAAMVCLLAERSYAAPRTIFSEDFESYTDVATSLADTNSANPVRQFVSVTDDVPVGSPVGTGIQVVNWDKHGGSKALLVRSGSTILCEFAPFTGSQYTLEFWAYVAREATTDRGFRVNMFGEGSDINGDDLLAYRVESAVAGSTIIQYYDGVGPGGGAWKKSTASLTGNVWQHHKVVIDPHALTFSLYLDDMTTPAVTGDLARSEVATPTRLGITHEGNTADDLYYIIDDITLTVENSRELGAGFTEGFESYTARATTEDDADPASPWVTTEMNGTGQGRVIAPVKVQVVGPEAGITPHTGTKCLQLQGGQRAGVSYGFGIPTNTDLQITWWAKVPESTITTNELVYLRMSLYGVEAGSAYAGDAALLGYGRRNSSIGDGTSLTYYTTGWVDSQVDFTPNVWEEYRMITHNVAGLYTIIKNPSSSPQIIADKLPMIGTPPFGPSFMVGFSSSNGTNHPPVYVDDIEIKPIHNSPDLTAPVYSVNVDSDRFTNVNILNVQYPISAVTVDPRDNNTILFAMKKTGGAIYKASKVASGTWTIDLQPVVSGVDSVCGISVANDGALWWVHDGAMSARRLKAPWASNTPEIMNSDFGYLTVTNTVQDDDPYDICQAPSGFTGSKGSPTDMIIMDRGSDADRFNALFTINSAETLTGQTNRNFLVEATTTDLGALDLVSLTPFTSTEVATLNLDGQVSAVDANGTIRSFWPDFYRNTDITPQPSSMSVDPKTGKVWIADDMTNQIWSCNTADGNDGQREIAFVVTNTAWANVQIDLPEPGLSFSKDGSILVLSENGSSSGIGRLIIMHNEPRALPAFKISSFSKTETGLQLTWEAAGAAKYRVQRTTDLKVPMVDITGDLTTTSFTDTNVPGGAFYRVVATQ